MSVASFPAGFVVPSFTEPLDIDHAVAIVPQNGVVKGQIAQSTLDALQSHGFERGAKPYVAFRDYPMRDFVSFTADAARRIYPDVPVREGLRRLGRLIFPAFRRTLLGRVMYGVFGSNVGAILRLANKGFEQTQNTGRVTTNVIGSSAVRLHFVDTYTFLSTYHYGIIEGTLAELGVDGEVRFKAASETEGEIYVVWQAAMRAGEQRP